MATGCGSESDCLSSWWLSRCDIRMRCVWGSKQPPFVPWIGDEKGAASNLWQSQALCCRLVEMAKRPKRASCQSLKSRYWASAELLLFSAASRAPPKSKQKSATKHAKTCCPSTQTLTSVHPLHNIIITNLPTQWTPMLVRLKPSDSNTSITRSFLSRH